jgi:hypothetical protein
MVGIASQDRLPLIVVATLVFGALVTRVHHLVCIREIEYRIACHNAQRLRPLGRVGYPDLAVKVILP